MHCLEREIEPHNGAQSCQPTPLSPMVFHHTPASVISVTHKSWESIISMTMQTADRDEVSRDPDGFITPQQSLGHCRCWFLWQLFLLFLQLWHYVKVMPPLKYMCWVLSEIVLYIFVSGPKGQIPQSNCNLSIPLKYIFNMFRLFHFFTMLSVLVQNMISTQCHYKHWFGLHSYYSSSVTGGMASYPKSMKHWHKLQLCNLVQSMILSVWLHRKKETCQNVTEGLHEELIRYIKIPFKWYISSFTA